MLETKNSWSECQSRERRRVYRESFILGKITGRLEMVKLVIRREKQYQRLLKQGKKVSSALESMHEWYMKMFESEEQRDILNFVEKYPTYSRRQLARRILWESEYWR